MTLKKAWYSKIITDLRQQHISGNLKNNLCNNCIFNSIKIPKPLNENLATKFDEKLLFYLETKGISKKEAFNLLLNGFMKVVELPIDYESVLDNILDKVMRR